MPNAPIISAPLTGQKRSKRPPPYKDARAKTSRGGFAPTPLPNSIGRKRDAEDADSQDRRGRRDIGVPPVPAWAQAAGPAPVTGAPVPINVPIGVSAPIPRPYTTTYTSWRRPNIILPTTPVSRPIPFAHQPPPPPPAARPAPPPPAPARPPHAARTPAIQAPPATARPPPAARTPAVHAPPAPAAAAVPSPAAAAGRPGSWNPFARPAAQQAPESREQFAASIARLLQTKTAYDPADMLDEDGNRKSLEQLLAMAKLAPIWSMLSPHETSAVQYTAGVLRNDAGFIIRDSKPSGFPKKVRPMVMTVSGPITL